MSHLKRRAIVSVFCLTAVPILTTSGFADNRELYLHCLKDNTSGASGIADCCRVVGGTMAPGGYCENIPKLSSDAGGVTNETKVTPTVPKISTPPQRSPQ
jgi:hypothetical protein